MRNILLGAAASLALGVALAASAQAQTKLGVAGPLPGSNAAFGTQLKVGADQAIADLNAKGGVLGKPVVEDAVFGFRAAGPALLCNMSYFDQKIVGWDPVKMKVKA